MEQDTRNKTQETRNKKQENNTKRVNRPSFSSLWMSLASVLNHLSEAYGPLLGDHWEKRENPQHYDRMASQEVNPAPRRHVLGLVGGNDVSRVKALQVDMESDLRRLNLPLTFAPSRQYQPPTRSQKEIVRDNVKVSGLRISVEKDHLPSYQMWAYPSVVGPVPMVNHVCVRPEKY